MPDRRSGRVGAVRTFSVSKAQFCAYCGRELKNARSSKAKCKDCQWILRYDPSKEKDEDSDG